MIFGLVADLFRSRAALEAEILVLRQQIIVLRRGKPTRLPFMATDKLVLGWVCRLFPNARDALAIVRPETVVRWHRAGFRSYWRWKSSRRPGRPVVPAEIREVDPRDEHCQSAVGSAADSWRTAQARDRYWADQRRQVHGAEARDLRRRDGRHFFAIMRTASPPWTCSWCRPSRSGYCMGC